MFCQKKKYMYVIAEIVLHNHKYKYNYLDTLTTMIKVKDK